MKAVVLVKNGAADKAFEIREVDQPKPSKGEVQIKVEGFGLNFADVMARLGLYKLAPPLPSIIGYDVVGTITKTGEDVTHLKVGQRVLALTRFGGYAEYAATDTRGVVPIPDDMPAGEAVALATQYCTAYYCTHEVMNLHKDDYVLIQAAAGGVGIALVQLAKHKGCKIFGTASSKKIEFLKNQGVDYPIDYTKDDFEKVIIDKIGENKIDAVFDSIGGKSVKKGFNLLGTNGKIVCYGATPMSDTVGNIFKKLKIMRDFGKYSPIELISGSKSIIGVNMLPLADNKPDIYQDCLNNLIDLYNKKIIQPVVGGEFNVNEIAEAHQFLESRQSVGKIVVKW